MKKTVLKLVLVYITCIFLTGCSRNIEPVSKSGFYFDTVITVTLYDTEQIDLLDDCFSLAKKYENLFSKTIETSDVYKINHSNGEATVVDKETLYLIEKAVFYAKLSDGAIDPTVLPLSDLWAFGENETVPDIDAVALALSNVNYENIIIDNAASSVTLKGPNAGIDLGFIAKGYIADKMKEYLTSKGVKSGLINLGGNLLTIGEKPNKTSYLLGIKKPFSKDNSTIKNVSVKDKSLVTSGIYERCFYENDILYHHILDTKTGYPISNELLSVTILSDSSMEGDAYSTMCLCLGLKEGMELIEATEGLEALFITDDMKLHYSSGFPKN